MANKLYEETHIQNIANAIREKTGKTDTMTIGQMAGEIEGITVGGSGGGDSEEFIRNMLGRSFTQFSNNDATNIGSYAFGGCTSLSTINFPACTTVSQSAFYSCTSLRDINLPLCREIQANAFCGCTTLSDVDLPSCSRILAYAFRSCYSLTTVSTPKLLYVATQGFAYCSKLTEINFIQDNSTFVEIASSAFLQCSNLSIANLGWCSTIRASAFYNCKKLMTVRIPYPSVPSMAGVAAFGNTPMSNSTYTGAFGSIYVPASLVSRYKTAVNWSLYSNRITAIT